MNVIPLKFEKGKMHGQKTNKLSREEILSYVRSEATFTHVSYNFSIADAQARLFDNTHIPLRVNEIP